MSKAWMPLYVGDFLADTMHLNATETGIYIRLIMHAWQHGGTIPLDVAKLSHITGCERRFWWRFGQPIVEQFFCAVDGSTAQHKRVSTELRRYEEISNKRKGAAEQMLSKRAANAEQMLTQSQSPREQVESPSQTESLRRIPPADAGTSTSADSKIVPIRQPYRFEAGIIKLTTADFEKWERAYRYLELEAELYAIADWAAHQQAEGKNWFIAVSGYLNKKNNKMKLELEAAKSGGSNGMSDAEGVYHLNANGEKVYDAGAGQTYRIDSLGRRIYSW